MLSQVFIRENQLEQDVFCVRCKQTIQPSASFCSFCGADQRPPTKRPTSVGEPTISYPIATATGYSGQQHVPQEPSSIGEPTINYPAPPLTFDSAGDISN